MHQDQHELAQFDSSIEAKDSLPNILIARRYRMCTCCWLDQPWLSAGLHIPIKQWCEKTAMGACASSPVTVPDALQKASVAGTFPNKVRLTTGH